MSCEIDGPNDFNRVTERTARKAKRCKACGGRIEPGHVYTDYAWKYDGEFQTFVHCARCAELYEHLQENADEGVDIHLDCGHDYEEVHGGPPPDHIAALAFWLPGEPIPEPAPHPEDDPRAAFNAEEDWPDNPADYHDA